MSGQFLSPSKKILAFSAGLALVTATVVLWGVSYHSGRLVRENAELALRISSMAQEPDWTRISRADLEKLLREAYELESDVRISFAAPCWAIVVKHGETALYKWEKAGDSVTWTLLDSAKQD
ncbi:MAG: hypothetical protein SOZ52_04050 [Pyramidobacter sp.]|nr:hypothetical protein [Pyramidobacter sp.]